MARRVGWRKVLIGLAIVVAVGGIGATGSALLTYHEATKIDRSNPKVVLDEYLRAVMVRKDEIGANLYVCKDSIGLSSAKALRADLDKRERDFSVTLLVSWAAMTRTDQNGQALITTNINLTAIKNGVEESSSSQEWRFVLVDDDDGWLVCAAERIASQPLSLTPSTSVAP